MLLLQPIMLNIFIVLLPMKFKVFILSFLLSLFLFSANAQFESNALNNKNALKTTFLSFYTGSAKITYERALPNHQSFEVTVGCISWGYDSFHNHPVGGLCRLAYKFIFNGNSQYPLNGLYVKPEFALSCFNYNTKAEDHHRTSSNMGTIMGCVGYQWAKRVFVAEGFVGAGVGFGTVADTQYQHGFISRWDYLTLTFGLKIGFSFGKKQS